MIAVFLVSLGIMAYLRMGYPKRLEQFTGSLLRIQILRQVMGEELVFTQRSSVLLFLQFILLAALFLYGLIGITGQVHHAAGGWQLYLVIAGTVLLAYLLKFVSATLIRRLVNDPGLIREYLYEVMLVNNALGILLFPLALGFIFGHVSNHSVLLQVGGFLAAFAWIFRTIQGLRLSLAYSVSGVYIILYLCTLEILPLIIFLKWGVGAIFPS